jgi:hypothetical protein
MTESEDSKVEGGVIGDGECGQTRQAYEEEVEREETVT